LKAWLVTALAFAVGLVAPAGAHARGAVFKVSLTLRETTQETVTPDPADCAVQGTITQTVRVTTPRRRNITAFMFEAGSLRGRVELAPSGSGYARFYGRGSVERQSNMGGARNPCPEADEGPPDCGTRSSSRWPLFIERALRGIRFRGIYPTWAFPGETFPGGGEDPFRNCATTLKVPGPHPFARLSGAALVDRARHVLNINSTRRYSRRDYREWLTNGTHTIVARLVLQRVRRMR
jgi:hypothetical protein